MEEVQKWEVSVRHKSIMASEANPKLARLNCWKIHFFFWNRKVCSMSHRFIRFNGMQVHSPHCELSLCYSESKRRADSLWWIIVILIMELNLDVDNVNMSPTRTVYCGLNKHITCICRSWSCYLAHWFLEVDVYFLSATSNCFQTGFANTVLKGAVKFVTFYT